MPTLKSNFVVLDVETGGKLATENPIIQLALKVYEPVKFKLVDSFESYIKPYNGLIIQKEALDYTQISMKDVLAGQSFQVVFKQVATILKAATGGAKYQKPILIGHNIGFDINFLIVFFFLMGKDLWDFIDLIPFDTMKMMQWYEAGSLKNSESTKYTLTACCERLGINLKNAHGAMNDVDATTHVFIKLTNLLRSGGKNNEEIKTTVEKTRDFFKFEY